jgi:hypothetical protein
MVMHVGCHSNSIAYRLDVVTLWVAGGNTMVASVFFFVVIEERRRMKNINHL